VGRGEGGEEEKTARLEIIATRMRVTI